MLLLKFTIIAATVMAVSAASKKKICIEPKHVETINVIVKEPSNCFILVVDGNVKVVTSESKASRQLNAYRQYLKKKNLVVFKSIYKSGSAKDIGQKLTNFGKTHQSFLAYFKYATGSTIKESTTNENSKQAGLLGNLLDLIGISQNDEGLVPGLLNFLGISINENDSKSGIGKLIQI